MRGGNYPEPMTNKYINRLNTNLAAAALLSRYPLTLNLFVAVLRHIISAVSPLLIS